MQKRIKKNHVSPIKITRGNPGFTIIELVFAILILTALILMAYPIYNSYIQKAKVTVATASLDRIQKSLESYHLDNNKYPDNINFSNCMDNDGHRVFPSAFCDEIKKDIYSVDSYVIDGGGYILKARAKDDKHTLLTLTPSKNAKEGS
jgi:prepilin-type N-terminal cleavage/methylation domain-containing protein